MIKQEKLKQRLDTLDVFIDDPLSGTGHSQYFHIVDFPQTITRGKTAFLIGGTPFLKTSTVLKIEVLDSKGEPMFVEPIDATYSEAGYKPISVVSYGDEANGLCKMIIVAEAVNYLGGESGLLGQEIPDVWKGVYNVRWTQEFFLDTATAVNTEPIRFHAHPTIEAKELITPYITISGSIGDATYTSSSLSPAIVAQNGFFDGEAYEGLLIPTVHKLSDGTPVVSSYRPEHEGGLMTIPKHSILPITNSDDQQNMLPHPKMPILASIDTLTGNLTITGSTPGLSHALSRDLELQIVKVNSNGSAYVRGLDNQDPNGYGEQEHAGGNPFQQSSIVEYPYYIKVQQQQNGLWLAQKYSSYSDTEMGYFDEQTMDGGQPPPNAYPDLAYYHAHQAMAVTGSSTLTYVSAAYQETQTLKSFAQVTIKNLKTYSGDVNYLKLFMKPSSQADEMLVAEGRIEEEKKFIIPVSSTNAFFNVGSGHFISQNFVTSAFTASLHHTPMWTQYDTAGTLTSTVPTLSFDETKSPKAMKISGSLGSMGDFYKVESYESMSFEAGQEYIIKFKLHAKKTEETYLDSENGYSFQKKLRAKMHIYMSGSSFDLDHEVQQFSDADMGESFEDYPTNAVNPSLRGQYQGRRVLGFRMPDFIDQTFSDPPADLDSNTWVTNVPPLEWSNNFVADYTGTGKIVFYIESGEFYFSDIEVNVAKETGFNPSEYTFNVPIAKEVEDDILTFHLEMFNPNGEPAILNDDILRLQSAPTDFSGGNLVIDGDSNLIVGSTFISNVAGSGIELAGVSSGFIRSVGYAGFTSASIGEGQSGFLIYSGSVLPDSKDDYSGVGLELHAGGDSGSLKFHAKGADSTFEVITPSFLLGKEAAGFSYVSGSNGKVEISSSNFHLSSSGDVSMQGTVTATDGDIGGFIISGSTLSGSDITLDSSASALFMSSQPQDYFIDFTPGTGVGETGTNRQDYYVKFGPNFGVKNDGVLVASGAKIEGVLTSSLGLIANWTIAQGTIHKSTGGLFTGMSSTGSARFFAGASTLSNSGSAPFNVKSDGTVTASKGQIGGWNITPSKFEQTGLFEISASELVISSSQFKVKSDGQITGSKVLFDGGKIGGFDITSTTISGSNLLIHKDGRLETSDFVSGLKGWRISAVGNGEAEFENATIRGTLSTTVFEKEAVNAVGGQLYVANSTTVSGSDVSISAETMSVANVTGFSSGEILVIKKTTNSGFNTEYVRVQSSSRDTTDENDLQGKLMIIRGYSGSLGSDSGFDSSSLGDSPNPATTYTEGQVIASTGKINTGFIRLNANPNDTTTPYMDIVERTGSAIYDIELKTRLGDLSGLSQTQLLGTTPGNAGFGLYSENVFLTGGINANYGSIGGFGIGSGVLSSSAFFISGSASGNQTFISASNLDIKASGDITGSSALFDGTIDVTGTGTIAGWNITTTEISSGSGLQRVAIEAITGSISAFDSEGVKRVFVGIKDLSSETDSTNLIHNPELDLPAVPHNTDLQLTSSVEVGTIPGIHFQASGTLYTFQNELGAATASLRDENGSQKLSVHWQAGKSGQGAQ